jgi:ABC-type proline/glycine betaine transport system permease subunit
MVSLNLTPPVLYLTYISFRQADAIYIELRSSFGIAPRTMLLHKLSVLDFLVVA